MAKRKRRGFTEEFKAQARRRPITGSEGAVSSSAALPTKPALPGRLPWTRNSDVLIRVLLPIRLTQHYATRRRSWRHTDR
jgi:hypothetical protein